MISWLKGIGVNNAALIALFLGLLFFAFKCAHLEVSNANLKASHEEQLKNIEQSNKDKLIQNQLINDELSVELNTVKQNLTRYNSVKIKILDFIILTESFFCYNSRATRIN